MSGGHWDYQDKTAGYTLDEIARDPRLKERFPYMAKALDGLSTLLLDSLGAVDYDFSSDSSIKDDFEFEQDFLRKLAELGR